jgi:hypothetical protein
VARAQCSWSRAGFGTRRVFVPLHDLLTAAQDLRLGGICEEGCGEKRSLAAQYFNISLLCGTAGLAGEECVANWPTRSMRSIFPYTDVRAAFIPCYANLHISASSLGCLTFCKPRRVFRFSVTDLDKVWTPVCEAGRQQLESCGGNPASFGGPKARLGRIGEGYIAPRADDFDASAPVIRKSQYSPRRGLYRIMCVGPPFIDKSAFPSYRLGLSLSYVGTNQIPDKGSIILRARVT